MAPLGSNDFRVRDLSLATYGRNQIRFAEAEMPGLMTLREELGPLQPLRGARIMGSLSMTIQTAVMIETLVELGANVRWASCNILSTQDEAAAAVVVGDGSPEQPSGVSVFAWKGETLEEYWWCTDRAFDFSSSGFDGPNLLLDDGGDATLFAHKGYEFELGGSVPAAAPGDSAEHIAFLQILRSIQQRDKRYFSRSIKDIKGVSEETTTGVHRLYELERNRALLFPAINVNDAVTKSKFDNKYGIRQSLIDGINRATDVLIGGKTAFVAGYGDVGKGSADALRGQGARVIVSEVDPICALQAAMDGYQVARLESVIHDIDIFVTATGNKNIIRPEHVFQMKHFAILANVGHFDNEIDVAGIDALAGIEKIEIKPQVHEYRLPNDKSVIILSEGRVANLGNATGNPSFVMSTSFTNQVLAQIELFANTASYAIGIHTLHKSLDEKVARLHLDALGVELTPLSDDQANYIGVKAKGPYKVDHYRY